MSKRKKHGYVECLKYMHMNKEGRSIHSIHVEYGINNDCLHVLWNQYQLQGKAGLLKKKDIRADYSLKKDIVLDIDCVDNDSIHINYYVGDSLSTAYAPVLKNGTYLSKWLTDEQKDYSWTVTQTKFGMKGNNLLAEFKSLNIGNLSFRKPLLAVLSRENDVNILSRDSLNTFSIQNLKFSSGLLEMDIAASKDMEVNVSISSVYGTLQQALGRQRLTEGNNKLTLCALSQQVYAVCIANVSRKDERHSKKVTVRLSLLPALHHGAVMMIFWSSQMRMVMELK